MLKFLQVGVVLLNTARQINQIQKNSLPNFSAVLNEENAATKKSPHTEAYGLWEFYLYRQKKERRQAPSGRELAPKATEGERVTMKLC